VFASCANIPKLLALWDYFYSDEGGMLYNGLTKEQGAATDPVYVKAGLQDGAYWFDADGGFVFNPRLSIAGAGGTLNFENFSAFEVIPYRQNKYTIEYAQEDAKNAARLWGLYPRDPNVRMMPAVTFSADDGKSVAAINTRISDIENTALAAFITGTTPLNDQNWERYVKQIQDAGVEELIRINQEVYIRFLKR